MKRILLLGLTLLYAQLVDAQCDVVFSKATNYYESKDYANAKAQFQKVVEYNCDSYKEIAQEYILLCEGYLRLAAQQEQQQRNNRSNKFAIDSLTWEITRLEDRIRYLDSIAEGRANTILKAYKIHEAESDTIRQLDSINNRLLQENNRLLQEQVMLMDSIRLIGNELNDYLRRKWLTVNKDEIIDCNTITDLPTLISTIRKNLGLLK